MKEQKEGGKFQAPGTLALVFIFLAWFATLYFLNWHALSKLWNIQ